MDNPTYILGHSPRELDRLSVQSRMIRPFTERLLGEIGLAPGMRVLEVGSGNGDLALVLAEWVGSDGQIVGIDQSPDAVQAATDRVQAAGLANLRFEQADAESFMPDCEFDLIVARFLLMHQAEPSRFLQAMARAACPGGVLAILEADNSRVSFRSSPPVPLFEGAMDGICKLLRGSLPSLEVGSCLIEQFHLAGLPAPRLINEVAVVGGDDPERFRWLAESIESLRPGLLAEGILTEVEYRSEGLEHRLRAAVNAVHSQVRFQPFYGAWVRV